MRNPPDRVRTRRADPALIPIPPTVPSLIRPVGATGPIKPAYPSGLSADILDLLRFAQASGKGKAGLGFYKRLLAGRRPKLRDKFTANPGSFIGVRGPGRVGRVVNPNGTVSFTGQGGGIYGGFPYMGHGSNSPWLAGQTPRAITPGGLPGTVPTSGGGPVIPAGNGTDGFPGTGGPSNTIPGTGGTPNLRGGNPDVGPVGGGDDSGDDGGGVLGLGESGSEPPDLDKNEG